MDWVPGSHASTFGGNPISCRAALTTIELLEEGLIENASRVGEYLLGKLKELQQRFHLIGDVRGKGLMIGVELVKDPVTKEKAIERAMKGLNEHKYAEVVEGRAEVRAVFAAGKKEKAAGLMVSEGKLRRDSLARVVRKGQVIHQSAIVSLRRFKADVKEVATGTECGLVVDGFTAFEPGDIIEVYRREKVG